jgi:hypothetical protein
MARLASLASIAASSADEPLASDLALRFPELGELPGAMVERRRLLKSELIALWPDSHDFRALMARRRSASRVAEHCGTRM